MDTRVTNYTGCFVFPAPTGRDGSDQHRVELDDGAEDVFGVGGDGRILPVKLEDQALVLLLQQDQDVLQEDGVQL